MILEKPCTGSHLTVLRRTKIGDYDVKIGVNVLDLKKVLSQIPLIEGIHFYIIVSLLLFSKIKNTLIRSI
jgi:hypothetical protein